MAADLTFDVAEVLPFMRRTIPGFAASEGMVGIGLKQRSELVAGVIYEGFNAHNVWMHVAATPGAKWLVRDYLRVCFEYPFTVRGVARVSGYVNESNLQARKFDEHLGFSEESRLRGAAPDGGDVILYVMWRDNCRFLRS